MLVMKFGGSSVADARQIEKVLEIVRGRRARGPLVVSSAHKGMTDLLIDGARRAAAGEADPAPILERQRKVLLETGGDPHALDAHFRQIEDLLRGIALLREASPRVMDLVQSFGERMSVRVIADYFSRQGLPARAFDVFDLGFVTDDRFGGARPLAGWEAGFAEKFAAQVPEGVVPIVTGFVGKTAAGEITTVGRNGSDFTATCVAAALRADECEIWTDTDGVMTADPSVIGDARSIPTMSFAEASELAYYGGRVLHPSTLLPAVERNIPVRVLNTNRPDHPGTVITAEGASDAPPVTSIAYKERQTVLTIESPRMLGQPGFLARIFDVLGRSSIDVDMISTSEVSVSMTCSDRGGLRAAVAELERHGQVTVEPERTIVCVVGKNLRRTRGIASRVFGALEEAKVNVEMISQGANQINLSFLIADRDIDPAIRSLHRALFG